MGMGTTGAPATPDVSGAQAASAATPPDTQTQGSGLTTNQLKAITMLMGNLGKSGQNFQGIGTSPSQVHSTGPQTSTIQGGTYINPNAQR